MIENALNALAVLLELQLVSKGHVISTLDTHVVVMLWCA